MRYSTWSSGTSHPPSDPTTSSPHSGAWPTSSRRRPQVTRLAQGPLVPDPGAGAPRDAVTDPLAPDRDEAAVGVPGTA